MTTAISISTSGRIPANKNTDDIGEPGADMYQYPKEGTKIRGTFRHNPLEPKIPLRVGNENLHLDLRFTDYDIPIFKWKKLSPIPEYTSGNPYLRSLGAMYISTIKCGISSEHLDDPIAGGLLRYHIVFTFQWMMDNPETLDTELTDIDRKIIMDNIPTKTIVTIPTAGTDSDGDGKCDDWDVDRWYNTDPNDYRKIIQDKTDGITPYGKTRITDSMLFLIYSVLLAQGKTGYPIVNKESNGLVGLTRREFKNQHKRRVRTGIVTENVEDTVAALELTNYDTITWTDICEGVSRVPNNLVLYKMEIVGDSIRSGVLGKDYVMERKKEMDEKKEEDNEEDEDTDSNEEEDNEEDEENTDSNEEDDEEDEEDSEEDEDTDSDDDETPGYSNRYTIPIVIGVGATLYTTIKLTRWIINGEEK